MPGLSEYRAALQMRDIVERLTRNIINSERPKPRYATVQSFDRANYTCDVQFPGESTTITVAMGSVQPQNTGQIVRVASIGSDYFIDDVIGQAHHYVYTAEGDYIVANGGGVQSKSGKVWFTDPVSNHDLIRFDDGTNRYHLVADAGSSTANGAADLQMGSLYTDSGGSYQGILNTRFALTGGGFIDCRSNAISWTNRFIAISQGRGASSSTSGYFEITMPPDGTVIHGVAGAADVTVTGGLITFPSWGALWYKLPIGSSNATNNNNFYMTYYSGVSDFEVPEDWVMIACMNLDAPSPRWKFGTGQLMDYPRYPTLVNGWVNYGSPFAGATYRKVGCKVIIEGLVKGGTVPAEIFTLPAGFRPDARLITSQCSNSSSGNGRVDIWPTGEVYSNTPAVNGYLSLNASFVAGN